MKQKKRNFIDFLLFPITLAPILRKWKAPGIASIISSLYPANAPNRRQCFVPKRKTRVREVLLLARQLTRAEALITRSAGHPIMHVPYRVLK